MHPCEHLYQSRLAGAVAAQKSEYLVAEEIQRHVVNGEGASELFDHVFETKQRLHILGRYL
jgi:hypothetical protein